MPPCKPPTGKVVLERLYGVMKKQSSNKISVKQAALQVSNELIKLWSLGDTRIPLVCSKSVQKNIMKLYEAFAFVRLDSRKHRKGYASRVSCTCCTSLAALFLYTLCSFNWLIIINGKLKNLDEL